MSSRQQLGEGLSEEKVLMAQLKLELSTAKKELTQAQSQVQELSNSLDQLNLQIPSMKASTIEEFKASTDFENILDEEFPTDDAKLLTQIFGQLRKLITRVRRSKAEPP